MSLRYPRITRTRQESPAAVEPKARKPQLPHRLGGLTVDPEARIATAGERELPLTFMEFELLTHLVANPRRVHTRRQLLTVIWGPGNSSGARTIDVHVARLRRKLGPEYQALIKTVRQVGYALDPSKAMAD
ncbi:winged helix-turn-helix domain-containing protein [Streptomyces sp. ET3-23]|uniref:winged helix-turn-helix domain-containing protein n=1 Tax=Streptomyces sp. ET3-23 TaxID=2885643 RepID=UPI0027E1DF99|nr:winged helix-turn-helix domain-containing protein [Streptomyces sp. ET3-23]